MKTVDLRQQHVSIDELLRCVGTDVVRITSKDGEEFVLEAADSFEREARELGQSENFMAFLAQRSGERGRVPLAEIEARLSRVDAPGCAAIDEVPPADDDVTH